MTYLVSKPMEMMESSRVDPHGIIPTYYTLNRDRKVITAEQIIYRLHNLPAYHVAPQSSQVKKKKKKSRSRTHVEIYQ